MLSGTFLYQPLTVGHTKFAVFYISGGGVYGL